MRTDRQLPSTGSNRDRSQAFTLEAFIGAMIILTAVLVSVQSVIITPTTSGTVNPDIRNQVKLQAEDILTIVASNNDLSEMVRYFSQDEQMFAGAINPRIGYGSDGIPTSCPTPDCPTKNFGLLLEDTFETQGRNYNVELRFRSRNTTDGFRTVTVAFSGEPSDGAVIATHRTTLYDNMTLTAPNASSVELWQFDTNATDNDDEYYPIPNAVEGPVYNVVEVRLIVW